MSSSTGRGRPGFIGVALATSAALAVSFLTARAADQDRDLQVLEGLRKRRQFESAEKYCSDRLADAQLSDARRFDLTIELSRTWAQHALESPPAGQPTRWQKARRVLDDFAVGHPRHPRLVLIRVQGALVALAQGEAAREAAELAGGGEDQFVAPRDLLRGAINELRKLDEEIAAEIKRRPRPSRADDDAQLSVAQLMSLATNVRYECSRGLRSQALCYPTGSGDRISSLVQANELLRTLATQDFNSPLDWSIRLDEITCLRLLEDFASAERKLAALEKAAPTPDVAPRLRAERIRLALARGQIDEALSEAGGTRQRRAADGPEADQAQLEAYLSGWQRAAEHHDALDAARWEQAAVEQVRTIERAHGPVWTRKAETLLARAVAASAKTGGAAALARAGDSYYRGGQIDEALAAYDQASERARETEDEAQAFASAQAAAAIELEREHFRAAIDRYRELALAWPQNPQAAEAHLLAVHAAARLAAIQKPPKLAEYERLLDEHLAKWPQSPTASQAWCWLGRLKEHERAWREALAALRKVKADHVEYAAAVEAAGRCYLALIAQLRSSGKPSPQLANEALAYFTEVIGPTPQGAKFKSAAARAATLAAARIALDEIPGGVAKAQDLLTMALDGNPDAPQEWKRAAGNLLVIALVRRGRVTEAQELLRSIPRGTPSDALALADALADERQRSSGDADGKLAAVELSVLDELLSKPDALERTTLHGASRRRAIALGEMGRRKEAIAELEALAKENPRDGQTQEDLASLLSAGSDAADLKRALAQWKAVAAKSRPGSPRWFRAHYAVASIELALGNSAQARSTIKRVEAAHRDLGGAEMKAKFERLLAESERHADAPTGKPN
jgi:tetratricopeptide (TPR) repeat protein